MLCILTPDKRLLAGTSLYCKILLVLEIFVENSLERRRFLRFALTGVGTAALSACGGGSVSGSGSGSGSAFASVTLATTTTPSLTPDAATPTTTVQPAAQPAGSAPEVGGTLKAVETANSFLSQNGNLAGWEYAFGKIVDDYSGGVFNPYWGPMGAMVFHGGGHSATFDNSVVILDFNDLTFKRLSNPTPSANGANWISTSGLPQNIDPAFNVTYCEYGDGQPGSAHTYDTLAILPPADGGAPCGSLIRVASFAVHVNMSRNTGWAHRFDFESTAMRDGKWMRWSVNGVAGNLSPGACSAYDSRRKRFWWTSSLSSLPSAIGYLDVATQQQMQIPYSRTAQAAPAASPDSVSMRYEAERDILVLTCTVSDKLVLAFLRCASPELGWFVPTLSASIPASAGASHPFDYVPGAAKFVLLTAADTTALYDIVPQQDPSLTWTVVRRPLTGVSMPTAYVAGKRWSYAPAAKAFIWMASSSSAVVAYNPSP